MRRLDACSCYEKLKSDKYNINSDTDMLYTTTYFMIPLMTPTDGSSDGCFPALLIGVGPVSWTKPTRTPATPQQHGGNKLNICITVQTT